MRSLRRTALLFTALICCGPIAGCESLPMPDLPDLSGWFDGNRPAVPPASFEVVQQQPDLTLRFHGVTLKDAAADSGSNEITLHFVGDADAGLLADVQKREPDWIAGTQANADTGTIVALKDVEFSTTAAADGFELTLRPRASAGPVSAPTVPVQTDPLRNDVQEDTSSVPVDGLQREDLRGAFGVDDKPQPANTL